MKSKEMKKGLFLGLLAAAVLAVGTGCLFVNGPLGQVLRWNNNIQMLAEIGAAFSWLLVSCCWVKNRTAGIGMALAGIFMFSWCHQAFVPLIVSGAYGLFLLLFGKMGASIFGGWKGKKASVPAAFIIGCGMWMILVCAVSAFSIGGTMLWRILALLLAFVTLIWSLTQRKREKREENTPFWNMENWDKKDGMMIAIILTCLLIQVGRMNVALDYDSLHYGLRSPYILDNGRGIYENLGSVNVVYTYAKGLEVLALPLSGLSSYGFVLGFNIWLTVGALIMGYRLAAALSVGRKNSRKKGLFAACPMALFPGILNMSVTAKSDIATLLFQLIALEGLVLIAKSRDKSQQANQLFTVIGACLLSYTLKPTSLVFSTAAIGMGLLCLMVLKVPIIRLLPKGRGAFRFAVIPALALTGLWGRTYLLTGMPSTSVFTGIWELLGFQVHWPFAFSSIPNEGLSMGFLGGLLHLGDRLLRMFFAPLGEDMDHVIIAWGTGLFLICLTAALLYGRQVVKNAETKLLWAVLGTVTGISIVSIYLLWQVDGNYFMLWYSLAAVCAAVAFPVRKQEKERQAEKRLKWSAIIAGFMVTFQILVMSLTSWAGGVGFTPVSLVHKGYYDHRLESFEKAKQAGRGGLWKLLSSNPRNRVIAFGEHPQCLDFACSVQSYYDTTGSGGNVVLVKTLENFKDYLRYAKTDYIYAEAGHLEPGSREWDVLRYLVEEGSLTDIRYENGNMVGTVSLDGSGYGPEEAAASAEEFYKMIIPR